MDFLYDGIGKPNWSFTPYLTWAQTFANCGRDVEIPLGTTTILDLRECGTMYSTNLLFTFSNMNVNIIYVDVDTAIGTSDLRDHRNTFTSPNLKELYITGVWGNDLRTTFDMQNAITVDFSGLDFSYATTPNVKLLYSSPNIENFTMGINFSVSVDFSSQTKLTQESLLSILQQLPEVDGETQILTLGSTNLAKLSSEQIAIVTNKNWTLA